MWGYEGSCEETRPHSSFEHHLSQIGARALALVFLFPAPFGERARERGLLVEFYVTLDGSRRRPPDSDRPARASAGKTETI